MTYNIFVNFQLQLEKNYDAAVADGSDESTASTRAVAETFGRVSRLGMHVDVLRVTRPGMRDPYTVQLEQKVKAMRQQSKADRQRITSLEAAQRETQLSWPVCSESTKRQTT